MHHLIEVVKYMRKNFFHRYLSVKVLPIWTILLIDVFIVVVSCLLAYALRYSVKSLFLDAPMIQRTVAWAIVINLIFFRIFRTYLNVLRFSSFVDIMRIFVSLFVSYASLIGVSLIFDGFDTLNSVRIASVSTLFIMFIVNFSMMAFSRVVVKMIFEFITLDYKHSANVFVYGAKEAGVNIAKSLRSSLQGKYRISGFIADEPELVGKVIMGVKVYPNDEHLLENMSLRGVSTIIVSPLKMEKLKKSDMVDLLLDNGIKLLTAPPLSEWNSATLQPSQIKEIQIEDLLERDPIEVDVHKIASHLEGKCVLITGAAGSIGSEIMRQVVKFNPYKLILVDQAETPLHDIRLELQDRWRAVSADTIIADISNAGRMEEIFDKYRPQYIFHAAAYKHVPMMEDNVSESIQVNVKGTRIVADLAVKYGAEKFVMVSTDKAVNPTNVMGCSKRIAEIYVQSLAKKLEKEGAKSVKFITTRFGNVLGSNGSVIPRFKDQINRGGPVTVTHPDIIRYFMTIPEACRLVLEAGSMGNGGEIYIFDMGDPVKIVDLAKRMINLSGKPGIKIEFTGLRHGEKLFEELLNVKEHTKPTYHEKIMIANVREYEYDEIRGWIEKLIELSYGYDNMEIVAGMKNIVPEFISKNSCFEVLDKKLDNNILPEPVPHPSLVP